MVKSSSARNAGLSATDAATPALAVVAADFDAAQQAAEELRTRYATVPPADADVIVALGGDGFMLRTIHHHMGSNLPIFGMNRGSVGFLMNEFSADDLPARLHAAKTVSLNPLRMVARRSDGEVVEALAINEVSLLRETAQAANIEVSVDGKVRLDRLVCDGVLVATPAGSTAYNMSAYGPILPLGAPVLALTAISAFRPRRWRGAILPHQAEVGFRILQPAKRPVIAVADFTEVRDVIEVKITEHRALAPTLLFDPEHNLEERILSEQFSN